MSIGLAIREIRLKKDLTQGELAEMVGVTQSMICQLERGTKAVTVPMLLEIADALGCKAAGLLEIMDKGGRS